MATRTGYKITVFLDDNPLSPTYMETYEERTLDESTCPIPHNDLVLVSSECEIDLDGYTGYRINIYYNRTTGEYSEEKEEDPECAPSSTEEQWVASGSPYCETNEQGVNTGYMLQLQVQMNINLENYGATRTARYKSPECGSNTCAVWDNIQQQCHVAVIDCVATFDGTSDISQIDVNPLSPTYNQTRTINKEDSDCENCTETTFSWVEIGDLCGDDELLCTNGLQQVSTNSYTVSQKYKTIGNGTPIPMGEYQIVLKTEEDEDCGFIRPQYKWETVAGQYLCDYETYTKYEMLVKMVSYDAGVTWATKQPMETQRGEVLAYDSYDCGKPLYRWIENGEYVCTDYNPVVATLYLNNGTSVDVLELTSSSLAQYATTTSAITVNSECREISNGAFSAFTILESLTIEDNVPITIGDISTKKMDILRIYVPDEAYSDYMEQWSGYTSNILPMGVEEAYYNDGTYVDLLLDNIVDSKYGVFTYQGSVMNDKKIYKDTVLRNGGVFVKISNSTTGCWFLKTDNFSGGTITLKYPPTNSSCSKVKSQGVTYDIKYIPSTKTSANVRFKLYAHNSYDNAKEPTVSLSLNGNSYSYTYKNSSQSSYDVNCTLASDGDYKKIRVYCGYSTSIANRVQYQPVSATIERFIKVS